MRLNSSEKSLSTSSTVSPPHAVIESLEEDALFLTPSSEQYPSDLNALSSSTAALVGKVVPSGADQS